MAEKLVQLRDTDELIHELVHAAPATFRLVLGDGDLSSVLSGPGSDVQAGDTDVFRGLLFAGELKNNIGGYADPQRLTFSPNAGAYDAADNRLESAETSETFVATGADVTYSWHAVVRDAHASAGGPVTIDPSLNRVTLTSHGLSADDYVCFTATAMPGATPALPAATLCQVDVVSSADAFTIKALDGTPIDLTDAGTDVYCHFANGRVMVLTILDTPSTIPDGKPQIFQFGTACDSAGLASL